MDMLTVKNARIILATMAMMMAMALMLCMTLGVSVAHAATFLNPSGDSATIYAGRSYTLKAKPGVWHGSGCSNYMEFDVYDEGGTMLERQTFKYSSFDDEVE